MAGCIDCSYEEFFLSSWAAGDPAMRVDINATTNLQQGGGLKASKAFYPDDPSNVYHSYMRDHVKFRINHASTNVTHVHHQHAHQWLHSPNSDEGHYMDSQTINPGASWTLEMVYNGSGNRNQVVGDNIFHCHFYPHFASGMWGLWRIHDVLEAGTKLDIDGRPVKGSRAYPDGEITAGTPIPAIVPMPTLTMAPLPGKVEIEAGQVIVKDIDKNPGYPFFIPGIAGKRAPHPPLDFAVEGNDTLDGGLPRHIITDAKLVWEVHNEYDWTKIIDSIKAIRLPEGGTPVELVAMKAHAQRHHPSFSPEGKSGMFILNGLPAVAGAPFAAPYIDDQGNKIDAPKRVYKAADIQIDAVYNKKGWHYPQQRMISLWNDVAATVDGTRPPQPFFFRANSGDYIEFWQTNLIPSYYELDDFQVRTPTDIVGQHIHLVKFDVTASDGAANGWNYEDGSFSPDEVRDRISGIQNGSFNWYQYKNEAPVLSSRGAAINTKTLVPKAPKPIWGKAPSFQNWNGAQTTVQLWYADSLINAQGKDRTIRTVFTHDHFGPSTHQQIGLYGGLLVEPKGSVWKDSETGELMGGRADGGPTSFQANILPPNEAESYREFALEFQGLQLTYQPDSKELDPYPEYPFKNNNSDSLANFKNSAKEYLGFLDTEYAIEAPTGPQIISVLIGTASVNYRNEPLTFRLAETKSLGDGLYKRAKGKKGDLAYLFSSKIDRADPALNSQPTLGGRLSDKNSFTFPKTPLTAGMTEKDPFTPLLRAYENDKVQLRTLVGAHEDAHIFNLHGLPWLFEPSSTNSGYRVSQMMSISEHFEMLFQLPKGTGNKNGTTDYLYNASSDNKGLKSGLWGFIRAYDNKVDALEPLPNNKIDLAEGFTEKQTCGCPENAAKVTFDVSAVLIDQLTNDKKLYFNERAKIYDEHTMILVNNEDLDKKGKWKNHKKIEPLVLRAKSGDCITINLTNKLDPKSPAFKQEVVVGFDRIDGIDSTQFHAINISASCHVGLYAQLLSTNANNSDGFNIGLNDEQTTAPGKKRSYTYYAGRWEDGKAADIEFGTALLASADPLEQAPRGLFGAIIIEPKNANWQADKNSNTSALVNYRDSQGHAKSFREFVIFAQDNVILKLQEDDVIFNLLQDSSMNDLIAINYRTEPEAFRGVAPYDFTANQAVFADPETPVFAVGKGTPVRIRLVHPAGGEDTHSFILTGHGWQEEPYQENSTVLGNNPESQWLGSRPQFAPLNSFDLLIDKAGGAYENVGDYLFRPYQGDPFQKGGWGIMRVTEGLDAPTIVRISPNKDKTVDIFGTSTVDPKTGELPKIVSIRDVNYKVSAVVTKPDGKWKFSKVKDAILVNGITVVSDIGGKKSYSIEAVEALIPNDKKGLFLNDSAIEALQMEQIEGEKIISRFKKADRKKAEKQDK